MTAADAGMTTEFVEALFCHADEGTFASLRTFTHNQDDPPVEIRPIEINGAGLRPLVDAAIRSANYAAGYRVPTVFAPPVATFTNNRHAREIDLANGLVATVELDTNTRIGLALLRGLLGQPTVVVASGGECLDPTTGEIEPKLHGHWRLTEPTRTPEEHAKLKRLRRLMAALTGGDPTNVPSVHPIRWGGSVHRKAAPKIAPNIEVNRDAEIDLGEALETLDAAAKARGITVGEKANGSVTNGEDRETAELISRIVTGKEYLGGLVALSARYAGGGMTKPKIVETLQGFLAAVPEQVRDMKDGALQPGRWQDRWNGLPRMAASAVAKFGPQATEAKPEPQPIDGAGMPSTQAEQPWPEPLAIEAMHGLAGDVVRALSPHTEADPAALLIQFLAMVGSAIGRAPYLQIEGDRHYPNIFVVVVGTTSKARKGTSLGRMRGLLADAAPIWEAGRVVSGLSSGEGVIWQVRDAIIKRGPIKEKGRVTGYQEVEIDTGEPDKRLLVVESEFASVLRMLARTGNTLSPIIRDAWDRGSLRTLTKNSPAQATGAHISIIGHVTADELRRYLDRTEAGNGFANRFLYACARRSKSLPDGGGTVEWGDIPDRLRDALGTAQRIGEVSRTDAARAIWHSIYATLSEGKPGLVGAVTARAEAQVMRLALLYAVLDSSEFIDAQHLMAGLAVWKYCDASAEFVFGGTLGDPAADEIYRALRQAPGPMSRTEISALFGRHLDAGQLGRALGSLAAQGIASASITKTAGRPTEMWSLA